MINQESGVAFAASDILRVALRSNAKIKEGFSAHACMQPENSSFILQIAAHAAIP
jgi:hypothetical protein